MPNSATIRRKKVNLVFIIYMVEIEMNAESKGIEMSDVGFFVLFFSNKATFFSSIKSIWISVPKDPASVNEKKYFKIKQKQTRRERMSKFKLLQSEQFWDFVAFNDNNR